VIFFGTLRGTPDFGPGNGGVPETSAMEESRMMMKGALGALGAEVARRANGNA
jgi:hypothetical protein